MERSPQLMFALQSPVGLRFGATQALDSERITFEMDIELPKGTTCAFRMELWGVESTVMGFVRIDRILPKRRGDLPRFVAKIMDMPEEDRQAYDGWRRDQATGGISRRVERDPEAVRQRIVDSMRGATEAESRMVLDKMNEKSIYRRKTTDLVEGDPFGLGIEADGEGAQDGASMRALLRTGSENTPAPSIKSPKAAAAAPFAPPTEPSDAPPTEPSEPTATGAANPSELDWMRPMQAADGNDAAPSMDWLNANKSTTVEPPAAAPEPIAAAPAEPPPPAAPEPIAAAPAEPPPAAPAEPPPPAAPEPIAAAPAEPPPAAPEPIDAPPEPEPTVQAAPPAPEPITAPDPDPTPTDEPTESTGFSIPAPEKAPPRKPNVTGFGLKPLIVVNPETQPIEVTIAFLSPQSFANTYTAELSSGSITVDDSALNELYAPIKVRINLPDGHELWCNGRAVAKTPNGMAIALELDFDQRSLLAQRASA